MKTFITDISASIRRIDFIIGIWLWQVFLFDLSRAGVIFCRAWCFRLVCDLFSGNQCWDIYKFDTNERVGVFWARGSVQHLVLRGFSVENTDYGFVPETTVSARIRILKRFSCSKNWIVWSTPMIKKYYDFGTSLIYSYFLRKAPVSKHFKNVCHEASTACSE